MKDEITYRPAVKNDSLEIAKYIDIANEGIFQSLYNGIIPEVDYFQLFLGWISDDSQYYSYPNVRLAEINGSIVGLVMCYGSEYCPLTKEMEEFYPTDRLEWLKPYYEVTIPKSLHIHAVAVDEKYRSMGIGKQLLTKAKEIAKAKGYKKLSLFTYEENSKAHRFYEREGFKVIEKFPLKNFPFLEPDNNRSGSRLMVLSF
jgi:ribosomal protein S18 acetylase RimI-like enzyme